MHASELILILGDGVAGMRINRQIGHLTMATEFVSSKMNWMKTIDGKKQTQ